MANPNLTFRVSTLIDDQPVTVYCDERTARILLPLWSKDEPNCTGARDLTTNQSIVAFLDEEVLSCPNGCCNSRMCKQTQAELQDRINKDAEGALVDEFKAWCEANKLPYISAGELILRDDLLNQVQIDWLEDFLDRWDEWEHGNTDDEPRYGTFPPMTVGGKR